MNDTENDVLLLLKKGKKGVMRAIYSHSLFVTLCLLVQVGLLVVTFRFLKDYLAFAFGGYLLFSIIVLLLVVNRPGGTPEIQLSWAVLILVLPALGAMFYLYVELQPGYRFLNWSLQHQIQQTRHLAAQDPIPLQELEQQDDGAVNLVRYMNRFGPFPLQSGTRVRYFPLGEQMFEEMLNQLSRAEHFIFLEYFTISEGYMWGRILKILEEKVKSGVEVRVLYDGTCTMATLPYRYPRQLEALGIQCQVFAPIRPILSTHYNNRDHRKIMVIDGKAGFTGGINIEDCYINRQVRYGHWKDVGILMEGPAVDNLTLMFLQMWNRFAKEADYQSYLNRTGPLAGASGFVLPFGDSPLDNERVAETVYRDMLNRARHSVHIMTPYLILDSTLRCALTSAAKRGVEVTMILPHIPDKPYAFALAKTHYPELIAAGVKIYEYTPGFVHAKVLVADGKEAVVGTVNFDYRSLYLHFECAACLFGCDAIRDIEQDFSDTLAKSQKITPAQAAHPAPSLFLMGQLLKLFGPLM